MADIMREMNNKKKVAGLFIDLFTAFDFVDRNLNCYGVTNSNFELSKSYLNNQEPFVGKQKTLLLMVIVIKVQISNIVNHNEESSAGII